MAKTSGQSLCILLCLEVPRTVEINKNNNSSSETNIGMSGLSVTDSQNSIRKTRMGGKHFFCYYISVELLPFTCLLINWRKNCLYIVMCLVVLLPSITSVWFLHRETTLQRYFSCQLSHSLPCSITCSKWMQQWTISFGDAHLHIPATRS